MKQTIKDLLPAIVLSITISFMLFIFEPITMYATNPDDFWFDLRHILPVLIPSTFVFSLYIFTPLLLCYIIFKGLLKKPNIYYIITLILFCGFVVTYIHGNYLAGSLPVVYGYSFNWHEYMTESIISICLWVIAFIALIVALITIKPIMKRFGTEYTIISILRLLIPDISMISLQSGRAMHLVTGHR